MIGVILIVVWVLNLKSTFNSVDPKSLIGTSSGATTTNNSVLTKVSYAQVERIEQTSLTFKIYFNVNNTTDDILNFSTLTDITLQVDGQTYAPKQLLDRQGTPFAQKILSHTQDFGILVFGPIAGDRGTLTLDNMSFETANNSTFKQELNLNFSDLKNSLKLRN